MKSRGVVVLAGLIFFTWLPATVEAKCSPGLVREFGARKAVSVAYRKRGGVRRAKEISIEWFGHAFFRFISPGGTRVVTDPFSPFRGFLVPKTNPHVATLSEESANHSFVGILGGSPLVLRGVSEFGDAWNEIDRRIRDVRVISVPIVQGGEFDAGGKAASFLFEMGGLCIAHLGDLAAPMNPAQLRRLGKVHVALVIISDPGAMIPAKAGEFIRRLSPNIAIPMDIREEEELRQFLSGFRRIRRLGSARLTVSRRNLPLPTEVVVLRQPPLVER